MFSSPLMENDMTQAWPEQIRQALEQLAVNPRFMRGDMSGRHEQLQAFVKAHSGVELAYMVDAQGVQNVPNAAGDSTQVLYDGDGLGIPRNDRAWFNIPARTRKSYISRKYVSVATQQLCMTVSVPVLDKEGGLMGVVAVDMQPEE